MIQYVVQYFIRVSSIYMCYVILKFNFPFASFLLNDFYNNLFLEMRRRIIYVYTIFKIFAEILCFYNFQTSTRISQYLISTITFQLVKERFETRR